ncbi:MAG: alpha/beta hydrolase [Pseudomonadota bacterium]|nr:alpha/beta hydrolase [Pseudomonadota bacterium]
MMLDNQLHSLINMLRLNPLIKEGISLAVMRETLDNVGGKSSRLSEVLCERLRIEGREIYHFHTSRAPIEKIILYLHGGGYVMGSSKSHRALLERLCVSFGGSVFSVDYRLAPEFPFPAALDDVLNVYNWFLRDGLSPGQLVVAGDSAGGGLALATLINIREEGLPQPACGMFISPWTDLAVTGESIESCAAIDPIVNKETLVKFRSMYLNGALATTPLASPLYANLQGLCPILIQVGGSEILLDDSLRLASKLKEVEVDTCLQIWDDMIHVWHIFSPVLDKGKEAIKVLASYANNHITSDYV